MPLEIRELFIKATIRETTKTDRSPQVSDVLDKQEVIADCVEEVMRILREEKER
ncbi:hypothetical protein HRM2_13160 [Desulforapulum autotrophicum HRM2]|jgi:hypothetical protein|uniref:Uncharacterized protein n=1 Tax=Desulforapulum autotrophicum (strain ATCC 43914 / DSM 3382 / VKM B-1955 / HRM2) TaxID=177437 RepID=C0Q8T7_DESAH|nr:DUF5908 family protein [Desulforapulum autotrophicum]ACN14427.1 hypothetical protein HRM2_13160 [Desulforapulum autotrophicum HRM2]